MGERKKDQAGSSDFEEAEGGRNAHEESLAEPKIHELQSHVRLLEDEIGLLRRRLTSPAKQVRVLEERLLEAKGDVARALAQNGKMVSVLRAERKSIEALREVVEKLTQPPSSTGIVLKAHADGTADIFTAGRPMRVRVNPDLDLLRLKEGTSVLLNEALNVIDVLPTNRTGEVVRVKELVAGGRAIVLGRGDEQMVAVLHADILRGKPLRPGELVMYDPRSEYIVERLAFPQPQELLLIETPVETYEDIGGLDRQIAALRQAVEGSFIHSSLYEQYELRGPRGVLLYGPPGCGKTLLAKALANSIARQVAEKEGLETPELFFLSVKGPELLNKYVGETERQIRLIFESARERAMQGVPVVVFFDEMDALFRARGTGVSSDVEITNVSQLLAEIDGVEALRNVIVVGASSREDVLDPALLRPGRLDVKIRIDRPDALGARDIMAKHLSTRVPLHEEELTASNGDAERAIRQMIEKTVATIYSKVDATRLLEVTYSSGDKEVLHFGDFTSGAVLHDIVSRAKIAAIDRFLETRQQGLKLEDLLYSIGGVFRESQDLPSMIGADDWARISGRKGEQITYVRTLVGEDALETRQIQLPRPIAGRYL